jgi:hypothetical protein
MKKPIKEQYAGLALNSRDTVPISHFSASSPPFSLPNPDLSTLTA